MNNPIKRHLNNFLNGYILFSEAQVLLEKCIEMERDVKKKTGMISYVKNIQIIRDLRQGFNIYGAILVIDERFNYIV